MIISTSHLSRLLVSAAIAGTALLAGCGPTPVTQTTTTTEQTTTKPLLPPVLPPGASYTTTETHQYQQ